MSCPVCARTKKIPSCTTNLTLGTIAHNSTAVWIYIEDITTGHVKREGVTSSGAGVVILPMSNDNDFYMENHSYEISVVLQSANSIEDTKDITVAGEAYNCLQARFKYIPNDGYGFYNYSSITVEIDD